MSALLLFTGYLFCSRIPDYSYLHKQVVSEPDPRKNWKEGLGDRLGRKCTVRPECRHASDWFTIACLCAFIGNTSRNLLVQFKETKNKQDLLVRVVVGAQISSYWANRMARIPEMKWVRSNNNKFHTFRSVHFHFSISLRPSFRFSEGLVPRLIHNAHSSPVVY